MCEDCESETLYENYAQKRERIAAFWRPARNGIYMATAVEPKLAKEDAAIEKRARP
jgi:hypothetical protein